jgi:hypothetical protein
VDLSLHKLTIPRHKQLDQIGLFRLAPDGRKLLKDVNKTSTSLARFCVSPIHRH